MNNKKIAWDTVCAAICGAFSVLSAVLQYINTELTKADFWDMVKSITGTAAVIVAYIVTVIIIKREKNKRRNKLYFFDYFEKNKNIIYKNPARYYKEIFYGMQAAIYLGEMQSLKNAIEKNCPKNLKAEIRVVLSLVEKTMQIFIETDRLNKILTSGTLLEEIKALSFEDVKDNELKEWCEIQRFDKLQIAYEKWAENPVNNERKLFLLAKAQDACENSLHLLDEQVRKNKNDKYYALLYQAFATRNLYNLYKATSVDGIDEYEKYLLETLNIRETLYNHYRQNRDESNLATDYITQEYLLSLVECYDIKTNGKYDVKHQEEFILLYEEFERQNKNRNAIFNIVKKAKTEKGI